jgi:hypothetical protein
MCDYSSQWENQLRKHMESAQPVKFEDKNEQIEDTNLYYYSETNSEDDEKNRKNECDESQLFMTN